MKKLRSGDYKARARQALLGKYGTMIGSFFLAGLIICALAFAGMIVFYAGVEGAYGRSGASWGVAAAAVITALIAICTAVMFVFFMMGECRLALCIAKGEQCSVGELFYAFRRGARPWRFLWTYILLSLLGVAVSVLLQVGTYLADSAGYLALIILGVYIILYIIYMFFFLGLSLTAFVRTDMPDTGIFESMRLSMRFMKKRKLRLLFMYLGFLPWIIPVYMTLGLAIYWIAPYMTVTGAFFYLDAAAAHSEGEKTADTAAPENRAEVSEIKAEAETEMQALEAEEAEKAEEKTKEDDSDEMPVL